MSVTVLTGVQHMNGDEGQIAAKREAAARARRLSGELAATQDRARLLAFADELDAQADALERASRPVPQVTQTQMQMQQGPPAKDNDKSEP
jgi:hypothetical protein